MSYFHNIDMKVYPFRAGYGVISGLIFCLILALLSYVTWNIYRPISPLMWSFIYGIAISNILTLPQTLRKGIEFSSSKLLRFTVASLGIVTSALIWTKVGVGLLAAFSVIALSLVLSLWLGNRLGLSHKLSALVGVGTSICGASAIAALAPAIQAKDEESGLAISGITLFGLASMFLYPFLFTNTPLGALLGGNPNVYAVWVGAGVHETAQVIAAAGAVGTEVVSAAMIIKSVRIFMIGPVVFLLSYICCKLDGGKGESKFVVPYFALAFVAGSLLCAFLDLYALSFNVLGFNWLSLKSVLSGTVLPFMFATAFSAVGSKVQFRKLMGLGFKPLLLAATVAVSAGVAALLCAYLLVPFIPV